MRLPGSENSLPTNASGGVLVLPSSTGTGHNLPYPLQPHIPAHPYVSVVATGSVESPCHIGNDSFVCFLIAK